MTHTYLLVHTDGTLERLATESVMSLAAMQSHVDGYIEQVRLTHDGTTLGELDYPGGLAAMVNEEGRLIPLASNARYPNLCGPLIIGRFAEPVNVEDGIDFAGLTDADLALLESGEKPPNATPYLDRTQTITDFGYHIIPMED